MHERTRSILESGVRDFIRTGCPITSECLYEKYDFGIKPAMIRWELNDLCGEGYFYQNHPSGGRIPTDRAYRFFVRELLRSGRDIHGIEEKGDGDRFIDSIEDFLEGERKSLVEVVARYLKVLGVGYGPGEEWVAQSGFGSLFEALELEDREDIMEVINDFELLSNRLMGHAAWWQENDVWPKVFVGRSPITKSQHLSVVVHRLKLSGENIFVFTIGPKRMDYEKSLDVLKFLERSVST